MEAKNKQRPLFLVEPDGTVCVLQGVSRDDLGSQPTNGSSNTLYFTDEKGSFIPCSVGHFHVHRGQDAERYFRQCNCPHDSLGWLSGPNKVLFCRQCQRTFVLVGEPSDSEDNPAIAATYDENGRLQIYTPRNPPPRGIVQ